MPSYTLHLSLNTYIQVEGGEVPDVGVVKSSQEISRYTVGNLVMAMTMSVLMVMVMTMNMLMTMTMRMRMAMTMKRQPGVGPI